MSTRKHLFAVLLAASATLAGPAHADDEDDRRAGCPSISSERTIQQVLMSHLAALQSGDAARVACDYANDAVLILPAEAPIVGRTAIQAAHSRLFFAFAGNIRLTGPNGMPVPLVTSNRNLALVNYVLTSNTTMIPLGVDSFVIAQGRIIGQTAVLGGMGPLPR